jgi:hypothetical protein
MTILRALEAASAEFMASKVNLHAAAERLAGVEKALSECLEAIRREYVPE